MGKGTVRAYLNYQEEDGWEFKRDDQSYFAHGFIEALFVNNWYYYPATMYKKNGDPGEPEDSGEDIELDHISIFRCDYITKGEDIPAEGITLTDEEYISFKKYMIEKVTDFAEKEYEWNYDND